MNKETETFFIANKTDVYKMQQKCSKIGKFVLNYSQRKHINKGFFSVFPTVGLQLSTPLMLFFVSGLITRLLGRILKTSIVAGLLLLMERQKERIKQTLSCMGAKSNKPMKAERRGGGIKQRLQQGHRRITGSTPLIDTPSPPPWVVENGAFVPAKFFLQFYHIDSFFLPS